MGKFGHKLMVVRLENLYLGKLQKFTWIGLRKIMCLQSKILIWRNGDANLNTQMGSDELDRFLWKLNGYENRIQFTLEREKEGILAFLDMLVKWGTP